MMDRKISFSVVMLLVAIATMVNVQGYTKWNPECPTLPSGPPVKCKAYEDRLDNSQFWAAWCACFPEDKYYAYEGDTNLKCGEDGRWNGELPDCKKVKPCPEFEAPPPLICKPDDDSDDVKCKCDEYHDTEFRGVRLEDDESVWYECEPDGRWLARWNLESSTAIEDLPTCIRTSYPEPPPRPTPKTTRRRPIKPPPPAPTLASSTKKTTADEFETEPELPSTTAAEGETSVTPSLTPSDQQQNNGASVAHGNVVVSIVAVCLTMIICGGAIHDGVGSMTPVGMMPIGQI